MAIPKGQKQKEIVNRINSYISEGIDSCDTVHTRMEQNNIYASTEQWSKGDILKQQLKDRPHISWNSIFKIVEAIANKEIVERFVPKIYGRSDMDEGISDILDEACKWQRNMALSEHLESSAVRSTVVGGYGWMHKYWDQSQNNGQGKIVDEDVPVWEMLWPARSRTTNLIDRRWHVRGKWITVDEAKARWGDISAKANKHFRNIDIRIGNSNPIGNDTGSDLRPGYRSGAFGWGSLQNGSWINTAEREIFVVEAEWKEPEPVYQAAIPVRFNEWEQFIAGQSQLQIDEENVLSYADYQGMNLSEQQQLMDYILFETNSITMESIDEINKFNDRYEYVTGREFEDYVKYTRDSVKYALITDDIVLDYGDRPWGFSYHCITGFPQETREGMKYLGCVDIVKGPQDYKNALLSNMLAMYMSSPKRPLLIERGAVPDIDEIANKMSSPGAVIPVPDGFLQSGKMQWGDAPSFPPMISELLQYVSLGVEEAFGLSSIDLGTQQDLRRVSGNVVQAARAANNVIVARIFDSIRLFRKEYGLCNMRFIAHMYSPNEIIRIVGEEKIPDLQSVDLTNGWGEIFNFDVHVDEQPSSPSELMELVDFLTRTGTLDNWRNRNDITFEDMLRLMPQIPESDKRAMLEGKTSQEQIANLTEQLQFMQNLVMQASQNPETAQMIEQAIQQHEIEKSVQAGGAPQE